jgi:hypothetical protein
MKRRYRIFLVIVILLTLGNIFMLVISNNWPGRVSSIIGCAGGTVAAIACIRLMKSAVD